MNTEDENQDITCIRCNCSPKKASIQAEVDHLKQRLLDRDITIIQLEAKMAHELPHIYSQGQLATLRAVCDNWQDKYERLLEAHKRLQRVNQGLEDKLLRLVDRSESEKAKMSQDTTNLTTALTTAAQAIHRLKNENERYQSDLNLAIQLLQCNPSQYASHKLDMLPSELQEKVRSRMNFEPPKPIKSEAKIIRVPIPTFPPTAMVYSVNKCPEKEEEEEPVDMVSAAIMLAVLEEREKERNQKHCQTCTCNRNLTNSTSVKNHSTDEPPPNANLNSRNDHTDHERWNCSTNDHFNVIDVGTQTVPSYIGESGKVTSTCIYCQSNKSVNSNDRHSMCGSDGAASDRFKYKESPCNQIACQDKDSKKRDSANRKPSVSRTISSWDWHTESQDSGSPSTPTSLISASLSYESETSSFTSPHESPGHFSLADGPLKAANVRSPDTKQRKSCYEKPFGQPDENPLFGPNPNVTYRIPFNAHFADQDTFTTPIHRSPPMRHSSINKDPEGISPDAFPPLPVIYSTSTRSATETTL